TALAVSASNTAASTARPCSRSRTKSTSGFGLGRLPVWVVRMRSLLVCMQHSASGATGRIVARIGSFLAILRLHVILHRARPANQTSRRKDRTVETHDARTQSKNDWGGM